MSLASSAGSNTTFEDMQEKVRNFAYLDVKLHNFIARAVRWADINRINHLRIGKLRTLE